MISGDLQRRILLSTILNTAVNYIFPAAYPHKEITLATTVDGHVKSIGTDGSLITDISVQQLNEAPRDDSLSIKFGGHETFGLFEANHQQPESTMVAKIDSDELIVIEIVGMRLSEMLGIGVGEQVKVSWK